MSTDRYLPERCGRLVSIARRRLFLLLIVFLAAAQAAPAMDRDAVAEEYHPLVPQFLLSLLHAPEVQEELELSSSQRAKLETLFMEIDGSWFRARILPAEKQREIIGKLEERVHQWFTQHASDEQHKRLRQLEVQAQSIRSLLRKDVARSLNLESNQQQELADLAQKTDEAKRKLAAARVQGETLDELESEAASLVEKEQRSLSKIVRAEQLQKISGLVGEPFDTKSLKRIYPMAPEFVPVEQWLHSDPLTLEQLRGKVVLVHFYAFQCHNCHANFDVYRRWHEELTDQGVVVIGIQTPETSRERDPDAVKAAAEQRDLQFPIILDLESQNWKAYGNTMWPTVYVIDKNGYIRHWWQGELRWKGATGDEAIEAMVRDLLAEK